MTLSSERTQPEFDDGQSLTASIYDALRRDILSAQLLPGARLQTRSLCARYGVGLSPVREALSLLASEDLVVRRDRRGFIVAPVDEQDLEDLTKARCWINEVGLRHSFANGGAEWKEAVVVALHQLVQAPRTSPEGDAGRNPHWEFAHAHFHRSLIDGCGSKRLINTACQMFDAAERYRQIARRAGVTRPPNREHRDIVSAVVKDDVERAASLLNSHIRRTADMVRDVLKSQAAATPAKRRASLATGALGRHGVSASAGSLPVNRSSARARRSRKES